MRRIHSGRRARTLLALLALIALVSQPDRALCIGNDGHSEVEAASGSTGDCCGSAPSAAGADGGWTGDECGPCRDVTLPVWTLARTSRNGGDSTPPLNALPGLATPEVARFAGAARALPYDRVPSPFRPTRLTTVIRR